MKKEPKFKIGDIVRVYADSTHSVTMGCYEPDDSMHPEEREEISKFTFTPPIICIVFRVENYTREGMERRMYRFYSPIYNKYFDYVDYAAESIRYVLKI